MSLESKNKHSWADIQLLYTAMNTARQKFSIETVTVPDSPGKTFPDSIIALNTLVNNMANHKFLSNIAKTGVTPPSSRMKLDAQPFLDILTTIQAIQNACDHCSSHSSGGGDSCGCGPHTTFGYCTSSFSSPGTSCLGFACRTRGC